MFYVKNRPKTLANTQFLCYNPFRYTKEVPKGKNVQYDTKNTPFYIIKWFIKYK